MSSDINLITQFDQEYPEEDMVEGIALLQAVVFGDCLKCPYYKQCNSDDTFRFPSNAACMERKKKLEKEMR